MRANIIQTPQPLPLPISRDIRTQNPIPGLRQRGILVPQEPPELRVGALEHGQAADTRFDINTDALCHIHLHGSGFLAVLDERVRVRLAVDVHARPSVGDDRGMGGVNVRVCLDEVGAKDRAEELRGRDGMLFGEDVNGVFDGVGCDDDAVVCFCVSLLC